MSFLDIYKKINTFTYPLQKLYPERTVVWKYMTLFLHYGVQRLKKVSSISCKVRIKYTTCAYNGVWMCISCTHIKGKSFNNKQQFIGSISITSRPNFPTPLIRHILLPVTNETLLPLDTS